MTIFSTLGATVACGVGGFALGFYLANRRVRIPRVAPVGAALSQGEAKAEAAPEIIAVPEKEPVVSVPAPERSPGGGSAESPQLMLGIVDAIDEVELMKKRASPAEQAGLVAVQDRLRDLVELSGGEIIHETSWKPALQRAVKVEPAESGQTAARYVKTLSSGLKHAGRIIRKQDVVISQPKP